jgi:hypothetical protein
VTLEGLLLARACAGEWFRKYLFFSSYVACVFIQDVLLLAIYLFKFKYYKELYWYGEFFSLLIGCGVSWEIFRLVLRRYPGAGRMARNVLLFVLIVVCTKGFGNAWNGEVPWQSAAIELERNLRAVQALSLIVLCVLSVYYEVPISRNVKGIFTGYGLFIASSVVTLTLRASLGRTFQSAWVFLQPLSYTAVLTIWCASLWRYEPAATPELHAPIEEDYRSLAMATRKGLHSARALLGKAMRP